MGVMGVLWGVMVGEKARGGEEEGGKSEKKSGEKVAVVRSVARQRRRVGGTGGGRGDGSVWRERGCLYRFYCLRAIGKEKKGVYGDILAE